MGWKGVRKVLGKGKAGHFLCKDGPGVRSAPKRVKQRGEEGRRVGRGKDQ